MGRPETRMRRSVHGGPRISKKELDHGMAGFILKRLLQAVFVVLAVTLIVSFAIRLSGDPAVMLAGGSNITEKDLQNIRQALGLERPFYVQYLSFLQGLLVGDFGRSFMGGTPVSRLIAQSLPAT